MKKREGNDKVNGILVPESAPFFSMHELKIITNETEALDAYTIRRWYANRRGSALW